MNKMLLLLDELHDAETDLAAQFRAVAVRQAADHGTHYACLTLAQQCDGHAERIRALADRFGTAPRAPARPAAGRSPLGAVRHKAAELLGRRPEPGLLLLRDLRQLYQTAAAVDIHWIGVGQAAQVLHDEALLGAVSGLHKESLTQMKWLKTRVKEATPQIITVPV